MNDNSKFDALIARARGEQPPRVDVADRVIGILSGQDARFEPAWDRPLMWVAALSSAVAIPAVVAAVLVYQVWTDPLFELTKAISWVMQ